ncbi:MAG TPA: AIR synthase related protein, partial [Clostridia bacterium]
MAKQYKRHPKQINEAYDADAEIIVMSSERWFAISTDHVDFVNDYMVDVSFFDCGYHSVCVSLSDIAAVGADPEGILLSVCVPKETSSENIEEFAKGVSFAAEKYGTFVLGGDTTASGEFSVTSTVFGFMPCQKALLRKGAMPGDSIFLSGLAGRANGRAYANATGREASAPKFSIEPRIELGRLLRDLATS